MSPTDSSKGFDASCEPLLQLVFRHIDDSMLWDIAGSDYGWEACDHYHALLAIMDGYVPAPMALHPLEVLQLFRFCRPDEPNRKPGRVGSRGHWMRLFSCAVLIRSDAEPESQVQDTSADNTTVIHLVDSALKLGRDTSLAALQFLRWRTRYRELDEWSNRYFAVAILFLSISLDLCDSQTAAELIATADSGWIPFAQCLSDEMFQQTWKDIANRILPEAKKKNKVIIEFDKIFELLYSYRHLG